MQPVLVTDDFPIFLQVEAAFGLCPLPVLKTKKILNVSFILDEDKSAFSEILIDMII